MSGLRVLLATPRFWPFSDDVVTTVTHLAAELRAQGVWPEILTPRVSLDWPPEIVHRETPVHRLGESSSTNWGSYRLARDVSRWLRQHIAEYDLMYVFGLRLASYGVTRVLRRSGCPVVFRPLRAGPGGDCDWQSRTVVTRRMKLACQTVDAMVAASELMFQEMLTYGYSPERIRLIRDGVPPADLPTSGSRQHTRLALAEINWDLKVPDYAPVVAYVGTLTSGVDLLSLVRAWEPVATRWPSAALWLIGDGPQRRELYELAGFLGIQNQVRLPGTFDDISDLLRAVDVFVYPTTVAGPQAALLQAMAAGLPIVASDMPLHREILGTPPCGEFYSVGNQAELTRILETLIDKPEVADKLGRAARLRATEGFPLAEMARKHVALFEQLVAAKRRRPADE